MAGALYVDIPSMEVMMERIACDIAYVPSHYFSDVSRLFSSDQLSTPDPQHAY